MPKLILAKHDGGLFPTDEVSEEYINKMGDGEERMIDVRKARNPRHHRKAWAVLTFAHQNQEQYPSPEAVLDAVKIKTGFVKEYRIRTKDDKVTVYYVTKSIAFQNMGQDEFNDFYALMLDALAELTGIPQYVLDQSTLPAPLN